MKDGVNGVFGGNAQIPGKPSDQELADLASAPMRLIALGRTELSMLLVKANKASLSRSPDPAASIGLPRSRKALRIRCLRWSTSFVT